MFHLTISKKMSLSMLQEYDELTTKLANFNEHQQVLRERISQMRTMGSGSASDNTLSSSVEDATAIVAANAVAAAGVGGGSSSTAFDWGNRSTSSEFFPSNGNLAGAATGPAATVTLAEPESVSDDDEASNHEQPEIYATNNSSSTVAMGSSLNAGVRQSLYLFREG